MPSIVLYLIKCSISLSIVWLFYQLLLRRLTFYSMNRWYLIGYAMLSFLLPLIHIVLPAEGEMAGNMQMIRYIPMITGLPSGAGSGAREVVYTGWDALLLVLAVGALLQLTRLLIRYLSLRRIRKEAVLIQDSQVAIYHVNEPIIPFSFGKAIYINSRLHSEKEFEEIILHEYVHVQQRHSVDILVGEILCIVSWFNPFSWLIRYSIRQNLEFIADRQVLASGLDRKAYQYHLLKVVGESRYRLANNFNFSSLKKRIIMMNKSRSARLHLVKFLFIVPLLGVLLVAFRDKVDIHLPAAIFHETATPVNAEMVTVENGSAPAAARMAGVDTLGRPKKDTLRKPEDLVKALKDSITQPMFIIDEVEAPQGALKKLNPASIAFINVLKNDAKAKDFGPRARAGVVLVYTKAYAPNRKSEITLIDGKKIRYETSDPSIAPARDTLPAPLKDTAHVNLGLSDLGFAEAAAIKAARDVADTSPWKSVRESLIIVDGKECSYEEVKKIDVNEIESINIIKKKSAEAIYGPKAKEGAMIIKLKKSPARRSQTFSITTDKDGTATTKVDTIHVGSLAEKH